MSFGSIFTFGIAQPLEEQERIKDKVRNQNHKTTRNHNAHRRKSNTMRTRLGMRPMVVGKHKYDRSKYNRLDNPRPQVQIFEQVLHTGRIGVGRDIQSKHTDDPAANQRKRIRDGRQARDHRQERKQPRHGKVAVRIKPEYLTCSGLQGTT